MSTSSGILLATAARPPPIITVQTSPSSFAERVTHDRIPVLDGVRAVAILTVVAAHLPAGPARLVPGDLGVTLFFVLSGFLITWLLLKEWDATGAVSFRAFLLRRALRIAPAYFVFLAVWYAGFSLAGHPPRLWEVAAGFTYTVNYVQAIGGHRVVGLEHAWSLAVEEQFYLLWPPLLALLMARGGRRRAAVVLGALVVGVFAWRSWLVLGRGVPLSYAYDAFDTRFDALAVGCLVAVLSREERFGRLAAALGRWTWLPLLPVALLVAWHRAAPLPLRFGPGFTFDAILLGVLLVQAVMLGERLTWRVLSWRPVRFVGRISYPLYLYHPGAMALAAGLALLPTPAGVAVGLAVSAAAACASWYLVETPFLRWKERLPRRPAARPHAVPSAPLSPAAPRVAIPD